MQDDPSMPRIDLQAVVTSLQQSTQAINALTQAISEFFPQQGGTSGSATGGAATLPANPVGFMSVTLTSGTVVKVPYYT